MEEILALFQKLCDSANIKKIIFSRPNDPLIKKSTAELFLKGGEPYVQIESFLADNKAVHKNTALKDAPTILSEMAEKEYKQTNIIALTGECEIKHSKKGKLYIGNRIKGCETAAPIASHDKKKKHIMNPENAGDILFKLGICDKDGRIIERKSSKFKQINRFLEIVEDVYPKLPADEELYVLDLCCGKSYLSFAVFCYLTKIKGRKVKLVGVDLKTDCVEYCNSVAKELGLSGIEFICMDIMKFRPERRPHMVISLHACDIATDITLAKAILCDAEIILSTPCCHHEMFSQVKSTPLSFITDHSMLKQKLCDAATDALRAKMLAVFGYKVQVIELIDPEETPKNILIRGCDRKRREPDPKLLEEYKEAAEFLGASPFLYKLLFESDSEDKAL